MLESTRLTVAIPTCNGARHLREALVSIKGQSSSDFDLIVSDDRSDDDSLAIILDEFGDRARVSTNSERLGLARNWNRCVELSRTPWVAIFHQDDVMHPGHLASHRGIIEAHQDRKIGMIAGPVVMIDQASRPISSSIVDPGGLKILFRVTDEIRSTGFVFPPGHWLKFLATENPLRCSGVTISKEAHQAVGGFDPSYRYVVDWDFWIKIAREWGLTWSLGPPSVSMRWHQASETHRFHDGTADLEETTRLLDALDRIDGSSHPEIQRLRPAANARLARAYLNRAYIALKNRNAELARRSLDRSFQFDSKILAKIALDPRLAVQMATLRLRPDLAIRWFGRRSGE